MRSLTTKHCIAATAPTIRGCSSGGGRQKPRGEDAPAVVAPKDESPASWMHRRMDIALEQGRITNASYAYFSKTMGVNTEMRQCLTETHRQVGDQDPTRMTRFQQQQISDSLMRFGSALAAERMQKSFQEDQQTKSYSKDGTPTGESYWFEEATLLDPSVPPDVQKGILEDMQSNRRKDSPAFGQPTDENGCINSGDGEGQRDFFNPQALQQHTTPRGSASGDDACAPTKAGGDRGLNDQGAFPRKQKITFGTR